jgi:glycosyltransferase involved in cell wall biosynthesis
VTAPSKQKLVYVVSSINQASTFEWTAASRIRDDFDLSFVLLNPGPSRIEEALAKLGVPVLRLEYRGKRDLPRATRALVRHFRALKPDIVHAHLMDASLAALTAARLAGVKRRIHTRHHSNLHHAHYPHAVYYDRFVNRLSTEIVATCENVERVLRDLDQVPPGKVRLIHFGFDLSPFERVSVQRVADLRAKYGLAGKRPVVGVIARYMEYKGLQDVIPAFERLLGSHPGACLFLANTSGREYAREVRALLARLPEGSYREVPFETDFAALYQLFDVFVHAPIDEISEAFGQVYVEALAARRPSVFTLSGIASEFVVHEKNALVVRHRDADGVRGAIERLLSDAGLGQRLAAQGAQDVGRKFPLGSMIDKLGRLYTEAGPS